HDRGIAEAHLRVADVASFAGVAQRLLEAERLAEEAERCVDVGVIQVGRDRLHGVLLGRCLAATAKLDVEGVEPVRPERAIALEPGVELGERPGVERVDAALTLAADADEAVLATAAQSSKRTVEAGSPAVLQSSSSRCGGSSRMTAPSGRPSQRATDSGSVSASHTSAGGAA